MNQNTDTEKLKQFIEKHIPFYELKEVGFWAKGTRKTDYEKIAARVCEFFGYQSIYEYDTFEMTQVSETVVTGKFSDTIDKDGNLKMGGGFHLDIVETEFECPICTCQQDATEHRAYYNAKSPFVKIKCKGCRRELQLFNDIGGKLTVTEKLK